MEVNKKIDCCPAFVELENVCLSNYVGIVILIIILMKHEWSLKNSYLDQYTWLSWKNMVLLTGIHPLVANDIYTTLKPPFIADLTAHTKLSAYFHRLTIPLASLKTELEWG